MPCIRCGSFLRGDEPFAGVGLCDGCLAGDRKGPEPIVLWPPSFALRWRIPVAVALGLLLLGTWFHERGAWLLARSQRADFAAEAVLLGLIYPLSAVLVVGIWPRGSARWKREVLERLGVSPDRAAAFRLVIAVTRRASVFAIRQPFALGVFAASAGGIAFLGLDGTRTGVPARELVRAEVAWLWFNWPPRRVLRVVSRAGDECFFTFLDAPDRRQNLALARRYADELTAFTAGASSQIKT